jgi:hypothetical protein
MKPIERLDWYFRQHNIKYAAAERLAGIANGYLGKQIKSGASLGSEILEKLFAVYPALNPAWLLTGKGAYLLTKEATPAVTGASPIFKEFSFIENLDINDKEKIEFLRQLIVKLELQIEVYKKELELTKELLRAAKPDSSR